MNNNNKKLCRFTGTALLWFYLVSISDVSMAMGLNEFLADSINAHPSIREKVHVFREIDQDRDIADSGWRPSIDLEAQAGTHELESPATGPATLDYESTRAELSITQNLFNGFDTKYQQKQTQARVGSALYEIYDTADNIALEGIQAYLEVLKQQSLYELAETNVSSHERILSQIRERNDSGVGRRSELQQTEGRVARAHASLIAQQNNLQDAATRLHEVLGRYVPLSELSEPEIPKKPGYDLDAVIDQALKSHPALKVAAYNIEAAIHDSSRARRSNYPKVDLRLAKEIGDDLNGITGDTDDLSLVLNMSYNLYRGGADRAEQRKKISIVHQNQEFITRVRRQVINSLRLAWVADQSLSRQIKYLSTHIEKARETVESYGEEFFIGQRDLIDLLDAESELNNAQNQHATAYYDALEARYRVLEAMGLLFPALNVDVSVNDDDLRIAKIIAKGNDLLPLVQDVDEDLEKNVSDHCDNTHEKDTVNEYGCQPMQLIELGYNKVNKAPIVNDDQVQVEMNSVLVIPQHVLLENDNDEDGDGLRLIDFTQPEKGSVAFDKEKNLIYRGAEGFSGNDNFKYTVTDGEGATAVANVIITVKPRSDMQLTNTQYVNYIYKSTKLTPESESKIKDIVESAKSLSYVEIEIVTHTDNVGSDNYNYDLSDRRAIATRELLIKMGLDANKLKAIGMGEKNPIADNSTDEGRAINRRGELRFKLGVDNVDKSGALLRRRAR